MATTNVTNSNRPEDKRARRMAARAEMRKRQEEIRRRRQQQRLLVRVVGALVALLILAGIAYWGYTSFFVPLPGTFVADLGNAHGADINAGPELYNSNPPTSGPHVDQVPAWGVHTRPIPLPLQVHALEDGGVLVQYNCPDDCPELVEQLKTIVNRYDKHVILAPYPNMESRIALTAWTRIDTMQEFDAERIQRFIDAYQGKDHHRAGQS